MSDKPLSDDVIHTPDDQRWRPWRMDELSRENAEGSDARDHAQRLEQRRRQQRQRLAEERAALHRKTRDIAHREGYDAGFAEGRQAGYEQGLQEGREAGEQEAKRQLDDALAPLGQLASEFRAALDAMDTQLADQLVELAMLTGKHLADEALAATPEHVVTLVRQLLHEEPVLDGPSQLWLHPDDLTLVNDHLGNELEAAHWTLHEDAALQRGGCRAESATGGLDATLETRWQTALNQRRQRHVSPSPATGSEAGDD
ncbi:flagellar assembly protein FliH [Chromohalobacter marismortui]|uniref:Flagellar assembly protein FliH n=1 Tax=Chromohalobacter marismortui TaxID=42055 RepID=A0A4V3F3U3_9GAMM|nr:MULTISPECIES: flagellar assembly protein FliH [Chromohalobacter]MCI0508860.1 flagellar assembly protein FliH [Chromohalobacter sp.]MCI0594283.1 flagellar assembly protein FliH [Chromohalobacter sp.]TDU22766.1 flagellar assembly protein FliH [Chromohalobacter marismortui]